jgi:transglutaminase-like putative cysteine protease
MSSNENGDKAHYSIVHTTEYRYVGDVSEQHNSIRVRPHNGDGQVLEAFDVTIDPGARLYSHTDYFGTRVIQFAISGKHDHLSIRAESRVRISEPEPPPDPGWELLATPEYAEHGAEYLGPLDPPANPERITELVAEARGRSPLEMLKTICNLIPDRFEYRAGVTYVGSTVNDLLAGGAGVCQDFVHLALTMMRREGIACRYVSGYLYVHNGDGSASAEVNTHAWLEALLPDEDGTPHWVAADPTNRNLTGVSHVKIGHGRAYSDVPPIRGVYRGPPHGDLDASVTMTLIGD